MHTRKQPRTTVVPLLLTVLQVSTVLGNIARNVSPPSTGGFAQQGLSEEKAAEARDHKLLRWALQAEVRYILPEERVAQCLRRMNPMAIGVQVLLSPEHQVAHYASLIICGSVWMCPLCAAKISERRREELEHAISRHVEQQGMVFMATNTIGHSRFDDLPFLLHAFLRARRRMKQGRIAQRLKDGFGIVGTISVLEVTWSVLNHWHPHTHELIFAIQHANDMSVVVYEAEARQAWRRAAAHEGLHMNEHGYKLDKTYGAVADNVAKFVHEPLGKLWGTESEMSKGHLKQGRGPIEHLTPFGCLYQIYLGKEELIPVFREYAKYFKGKHQLTWSSGLRALLLGHETEQTDEELAAAMEEAVLLGLLTRQQWRVVLANDARGELLQVAHTGDWELVKAFLADNVCDLADSEPIYKEQVS